MREDRETFAKGIKGEFTNLLALMNGSLEVLRRKLYQDGLLTGPQADEKLKELQRNISQLSWLAADLVDLMACERDDFRLSIEMADVSSQLSLIRDSVQQQLTEQGWPGKVYLEEKAVLYANLNRGFLSAACSNILANLYYYAPNKGDVTITVGEDRAIHIRMDGVQLPEMVCRLIVSGKDGLYRLQEAGVGTYGLLFAAQYCAAMGWQMAAEQAEGSTVLMLCAPQLEVSGTGRVRLESDVMKQEYWRNLSLLAARRAFCGLFAEPQAEAR